MCSLLAAPAALPALPSWAVNNWWYFKKPPTQVRKVGGFIFICWIIPAAPGQERMWAGAKLSTVDDGATWTAADDAICEGP